MKQQPMRQRGMALVISLLLLVAITLLAVSTMRSTTMQERMASNLNDRELAKQVAESTIRQAGLLLPPVAGSAWFTAALPAPAVGTADLWQNPASWANAGAIVVRIDGVDYTGQYLVENMGFWVNRNTPNCKVKDDPLCESQTYRITARTAPTAGRASVILQAIWRL
ncbi:MAG: PilX protein [Gammaproteobacteria bacterium]|jgi:type IV pilus assembly protein PilX|nr:PilX protein [Gammaproteobacteria bacterium]MBU2178493.1 PilX protein [Gammaproteobacteria bacterium]MBU2225120.1 PilX protein [Gammaproteobacteria bacterium]MBU2279246.1 PilX protein [Gammaproteobacteria bacterium]MBU2428713.1 PilX protein [Gammaproteobacteria bacterium]